MPFLTFPEIDPVAVQLGPLAVRWYGLAYFAGLLLGWAYARRLVADPRLWGAGGAPMKPLDVDDFLLWATAGIILGGRLGYAAFYQPGHYLDDPLAFLRLWQGGMSFHGGMAGTIVAAILFARRRGIPILSLLDVAAACAPIGLFFGRLANFVNGELWGRVTDVPWGMVFCNGHIVEAYGGTCPAGPDPRHPSQLYEAALEGIVLFLVLRLLVVRFGAFRTPGRAGSIFIAGYGLARFFVEFFREPDAQLGYVAGFLTMGMLLSLPMVLVGLAALVLTRQRTPA